MKSSTGSTTAVVGIFGLVGPYIGGLILVSAYQIPEAVQRPASSAVMMVLGVLLLALYGYVIGLIPALITGIISVSLSRRLGANWCWVLASTLVGAVVAAVIAPLFGLNVSLGVYLLLGGAGALASSLAALKVRPRPATLSSPPSEA